MKKKPILALMMLALGLTLGACDDDNQLDDAVDTAGDAVDEAGDAVDDASDEVEDAVDEIDD